MNDYCLTKEAEKEMKENKRKKDEKVPRTGTRRSKESKKETS